MSRGWVKFFYKNIWIIWIKYKNKIFDVDMSVDNVDNFVDKMWISVDGRDREFEGVV